MTKKKSETCYTKHTKEALGGITLELTKKVRSTFTIKHEDATTLASRRKLNKYMLSQFFIQLVNLQQLIKSMNDFVGDGKLVKATTLFDGLSLCLNKTISEMIHDRYDIDSQAEIIKANMKLIGIHVSDIKIKSLYPRLIKMSMVIDKPSPLLLNGDLKKQLERLLKESLKINIAKVRNKKLKIEVSSSRNFKIEHAVAYVGKDGSKISGDSYMCENFQNGTSIVAISDGMGNGHQARSESSMALRVLKCMLNFDIPVAEAVRVLAELKQASNTDERFFTLDLCMIDKENGRAHIYKQAATSTFLLRRETVRKIEMSGLPIGAVGPAGIDQMKVDLLPGDIIIMCSDGIIDVFLDTDLFEKRIMRNMDSDVNKMTHDLLNYTIRRSRGGIHDDMMVIAAAYKPIRTARQN